jgi:hypothetical protein
MEFIKYDDFEKEENHNTYFQNKLKIFIVVIDIYGEIIYS